MSSCDLLPSDSIAEGGYIEKNKRPLWSDQALYCRNTKSVYMYMSILVIQCTRSITRYYRHILSYITCMVCTHKYCPRICAHMHMFTCIHLYMYSIVRSLAYTYV